MHSTTLSMVGRILRMLNLYFKIHTSTSVGRILFKLWRTIFNNYRSSRCYQHMTFHVSLWRRWYYSNYSKSSYYRTKFTRKYDQFNYRWLSIWRRPNVLHVVSIYKQQLNIFGTGLVKNKWTMYVNTNHITAENTIFSTNLS